MVRFSSGNSPTCSGVVENVSARGIYLSSIRIFPPGTTLAIEFHANEKVHHMEGVVRWARSAPPNLVRVVPSGMGIELTVAPEAFYALLMTLETHQELRSGVS
jgi:hypothetical protein